MEWISVKDKPLFTIKNGWTVLTEYGNKDFIAAIPIGKGKWVIKPSSFILNGNYTYIISDVKYWMPFPEPPKE